PLVHGAVKRRRRSRQQLVPQRHPQHPAPARRQPAQPQPDADQPLRAARPGHGSGAGEPFATAVAVLADALGAIPAGVTAVRRIGLLMPSALSVTTETLPKSQVGMTIEVPAETVDATYEKVLNRLASKAKLEGFRPGRAPRALVEARLGPAAIREEVVEAIVP